VLLTASQNLVQNKDIGYGRPSVQQKVRGRYTRAVEDETNEFDCFVKCEFDLVVI
jgi:hypothetical protein